MCIGLPMQVIQSGFGFALCDYQGEQRQVDTILVGDQPEGTWLLVFINSAREVISVEQAEKIGDALKAVSLAMQGETAVDHLFADLANREPELPDFLKPQAIEQ